mmetsp:Transcript_11863/g.28741  ORF Transcript_11863/g.28741 Transcript_11863/m.28741 type:complete len:108 (+) Transcript_11863:467-790(+)
MWNTSRDDHKQQGETERESDHYFDERPNKFQDEEESRRSSAEGRCSAQLLRSSTTNYTRGSWRATPSASSSSSYNFRFFPRRTSGSWCGSGVKEQVALRESAHISFV